MDFPSGGPWIAHPSPSSSGGYARCRIGWPVWSYGIFCDGTRVSKMGPSTGSYAAGIIPNCSGLEVCWSTRENSGSNDFAWLTSIHNSLGDGGEQARGRVSIVYIRSKHRLRRVLTKCRGQRWRYSLVDGVGLIHRQTLCGL